MFNSFFRAYAKLQDPWRFIVAMIIISIPMLICMNPFCTLHARLIAAIVLSFIVLVRALWVWDKLPKWM